MAEENKPQGQTAPKFPLGQMVATPGALQALAEAGEEPLTYLSRHISGDWGG